MSNADIGHEPIDAFVPDTLINEAVTPLEGIAEYMLAESRRIARGQTGSNAYLALQEIMWMYVGDPEQSKRHGLHDLPGSTIETAHGPRTYSMGCAAQFDPESGEMCIVRRDPEFDMNDPSSWFIVRAQLRTGMVSTEHVIGVTSKKSKATDETSFLLTLVPHKMNESSQLTLTTDPEFSCKGLMQLVHPKYYGRGVGEQPEVSIEANYPMDISRLLVEIDSRRAAKLNVDAFAIGIAAADELVNVYLN